MINASGDRLNLIDLWYSYCLWNCWIRMKLKFLIAYVNHVTTLNHAYPFNHVTTLNSKNFTIMLTIHIKILINASSDRSNFVYLWYSYCFWNCWIRMKLMWQTLSIVNTHLFAFCWESLKGETSGRQTRMRTGPNIQENDATFNPKP